MPIRTFIVEDDGTVHRLSLRTLNDMCHGVRLFPEYAGRRLRCLTIYFRDAGGRRKLRRSDVLGLSGAFLEFDATGNAQPLMNERAVKLWESGGFFGDETDSLIHRRMVRDGRWEPTRAELDRVGRRLFKDLVPGQTAFPIGTDLRYLETRAAQIRKKLHA